jgi:hypothetical protein
MQVQREKCYRIDLPFRVGSLKYFKYYSQMTSSKGIKYITSVFQQNFVLKSKYSSSNIRDVLYIAHLLWGREHTTGTDGVISTSV